MMYTAAQYYQESPLVYGGTKIPVKLEPMEDMAAIDKPVDMSISARVHKPRAPLGIPHNLEPLTYDNDKLFGSYINSYHCLQLHQKVQSSVNKNIDHVQIPPVEHHPLFTSVSTSPPDVNGTNIKGDDGKLSVSPPLTKNRTAVVNDVDLISSANQQRAKREFVPDSKKDDSYWCKRLKNNDSARRSRVKRKAIEKMMETRLFELQKENIELKHEVAALRRRYGEEEGSSSDSSSSREKTSTGSPRSPPDETSSKGEDEQQSSCCDDSRAYTMGSVTALNHSLGLAGRDRADSVGSSSSSLTSDRTSTNSRPDSRSSGSVDASLRTDVTGALDLTSDHSNRSTPAWESSFSDSSNSIRTNRRNSCVSSDSSSVDDSNTRIMVFPLKCRWKKEMHSAHLPLTEELQ